MISMFARRSFGVLLLLSVTAVACAKADADADNAEASADEATTDAPRASVELPIVAQEARDGDLVLRVNTRGDVYGDAIVRLSSDVGGPSPTCWCDRGHA
jgi:hypothetical protein